MSRNIARVVLLLLMLVLAASLVSMVRRLERLARRAPALAASRTAGRDAPGPAPEPLRLRGRTGGLPATALAPSTVGVARTAASGEAALPPGVIPGEYILSFYNERDREAFEALARKHGAAVLGRLAFGNTLRLRTGSRAALDALLREGPVPVDVAPNYRAQPPVPVSGQNPQQPDGAYVGFGNAALDWLGAPADVSRWGIGLRVAVIDGLVGTHTSLSGAGIERVDMAGAGIASEHATAVASLIAARGDQVQGLAPAAGIVSYGVMDADGRGDLFTLASAIVDAVDRGCRVVNLSLCSQGSTYLLEQAVAYARDKGVVLVAATGNDGIDGVMYPAALDGVVAVGAVDGGGRHVYFSNRGDSVDLAAPGVAVNAAGTDNGVATFSGTSAAAPFVTSAVAALLSRNPDMTGEEAVDILVANADDHGAPGDDVEYGQGVLNVERVENRKTAGIVDVAAGDPWLDTTGGKPALWLYVENRGTEPLAAVTLDVEIDGVPISAAFYRVGVGETAARRFDLDAANLSKYGQISVACRAAPDGQTDAVPANNARQGVVRLVQ